MYYKTSQVQIMETPTAVVWLFKYLGLPGMILGILADFDWSKLGASFWIGSSFAAVRFMFYVSEQMDKRDARKLKNEVDKWEFEQKKRKSTSESDNRRNNQHY